MQLRDSTSFFAVSKRTKSVFKEEFEQLQHSQIVNVTTQLREQ
jgi:hypothetical protein